MKNFSSIVLSLLLITLNACISPQKEDLTQEEVLFQENYLEKGGEITASVYSALTRNLANSIKENGVPGSIQYCNINAYPITDSISQQFGVHIKRSSHKLRNPKNRPDSLELAIIESYLAEQQQGKPLKAKLVKLEQQPVRYFSPIVLAQACTRCHGKMGSEIDPDNYDVIKSLYPEDSAINFTRGELRGIWSVSFKP